MAVASASRSPAFVRSSRWLAALLACAAAGSAQSTKLSGSLAQPVGGSVQFSATTPDGSVTVFYGDQEVDGVYQLYRVPTDGSAAPSRLSDPAHGNLHFTPVRLTSDGTVVVYVTDEATLFRVPVDGSAAPLELASGLDADPDYYTYPFEMSADGQWAVYRGDELGQLFSVPIDGSSPPHSLAPSAVDVDRFFRVSLDGARVVFRASTVEEGLGLHSVPIDGSASPIRLDPWLPGTPHYVSGPAISPDSSHVVYSSDHDEAGLSELYVVPIDGGASVKLSGGLDADAGVRSDSAFTPDSARVVFASDARVAERDELYSVPLDGSAAPVRVSGEHATRVGQYDVTADGRRVVYSVAYELHSAPVAGGTSPVQLGPTGAIVESTHEITSDGQRVLYRARIGDSGPYHLYSVRSDGGFTRLPGEVPRRIVRLARNVGFQFSLHPDGTRVLYTSASSAGLFGVDVLGAQPAVLLVSDVVHPRAVPGDRALFQPYPSVVAPEWELYSVPLAGGAATRLNAPLPLGPVLGRIQEFLVSPDGRWTVYLADGAVWKKFELYSAPSDGSAPATRISDEGIPHGSVGGYEPLPDSIRITADSTRVVYRADHQASGDHDLYVVPIDGSAPAVRLTSFVDLQGVEPGFELSPDGQHAVFLASVPIAPFSHSVRVHAVRLDGSAPPLVLSGTPVGWANVRSFAVSADSTRVIYLSDEQSYTRYELFSVPIEGGAPVELQGVPTFSHDDVGAYRFTPDGSRVVYLLHTSSTIDGELYVIPADGSAPRQRFGGPGVNVTTFEFSPDGQAVVYSVDGFDYALYLAPLDASSSLRLNPPFATGFIGFSKPFRVSPDGARLVYLADQEVDGRGELYSVPMDGSAAWVKLHPPLPPGASVAPDFRISADASRVVFFTDAASLGAMQLYSVPIAGGAAVRLNGQLAPGGGGFELAGPESQELRLEGERVAYALDQDVPGRVEVYLVPLDASSAPRRVNAPLPGPSDAAPFAFAGANRLVYLAPEEQIGVPELFARSLVPHHRRR